MLFELIPAIVQKILKDKILLGLVVIGILALFVGGMGVGDDHANNKVSQADKAAPKSEQPSSLTPSLACDFVQWWFHIAMDINNSTAVESHNQATSWMEPETAATFQKVFWSEVGVGNNASNVSMVQLANVQAEAVNPDGSIVVGTRGTVILKSAVPPQQFLTDFLVKQEGNGLRIAGFYSHPGSWPN